MKPYPAWALRGLPTTWPGLAKLRLSELGARPNHPKCSIQSAPRDIPGIDPWACQAAGIGMATKAALDGQEAFLEQEEEWRGFPGNVPAPVAFLPDGSIWCNELGEPVPVEQWASIHLVVDQLLTTAHWHPDPKVKKRAWKQALYLRDSVVATMPGVVGKMPWLSGNARTAGYGLRFLVRLYRALPDPKVAAAIVQLLAGLWTLRQAQHAQQPKAIPFPVYNPEGLHQADHGNKPLCSWMILGPLLGGLVEVKLLGEEVQPGMTNVTLDALISDCLDYADVAYKAGEAATGTPGRLADDVGFDGSAHILPAKDEMGGMPAWAFMGFCAADEACLLAPPLRDKVMLHYCGEDMFDVSKPTWGVDSKDVGLAILAAGRLGWRL